MKEEDIDKAKVNMETNKLEESNTNSCSIIDDFKYVIDRLNNFEYYALRQMSEYGNCLVKTFAIDIKSEISVLIHKISDFIDIKTKGEKECGLSSHMFHLDEPSLKSDIKYFLNTTEEKFDDFYIFMDNNSYIKIQKKAFIEFIKSTIFFKLSL